MAAQNRPTNASLSTMWALKNYPDLNDFFKVSTRLGFQKIELNHQVDSVMLSAVNMDHVQFSSVHEPCPADISTKDLVDQDWLISSIDEPSRKQGVKAVKRSIDLAHRLGAPVVILHCGTIPYYTNYESKLRALYQAGRTGSDEYLEIKSKLVHTRMDLAGPRVQAVAKSMSDLLKYADLFEVKLGLENRYHYLDIPSIDELAELLRLADPSRIGFIYDVGHAQALDQLGFCPHEEWLTRFSSRMLGAHLHDVIGVVDHYSPGLGEIDFKFIRNYLPEEAFRTMEVLPGNTLAQVKYGLNILEQAGCIKYL